MPKKKPKDTLVEDIAKALNGGRIPDYPGPLGQELPPMNAADREMGRLRPWTEGMDNPDSTLFRGGVFGTQYPRDPPLIDPAQDWIDPRFATSGEAWRHRQSRHGAGGYYGRYPGGGGAEGSREWSPGFNQVPLMPSDEFYPPPTVAPGEAYELHMELEELRAYRDRSESIRSAIGLDEDWKPIPGYKGREVKGVQPMGRITDTDRKYYREQLKKKGKK